MTDLPPVKFWPSRHEVAAMTAVLDTADGTAESVAKAVLKEAYKLLLERDLYLTIIGTGPSAWAYGLSSTQGEAEKLAIVGPARVLNITSARRKLRDMEG